MANQGNSDEMPDVSLGTIRRFWAKVDMTAGADACWIWNAGKSSDGYGSFKYEGRQHGAHRFAYRIYHGTPPDELNVCHTCDNPPCVNPAHLFLGTDQQNVDDREAKGRGVRPVRAA